MARRTKASQDTKKSANDVRKRRIALPVSNGMSSPKVDVKALAQLARLEVSAEELAKLEKQIPDILAFVETIQKVSGDAGEAKPMLKNVMRDDASSSGGPHEPGIYTKTLLDAAPAKEGDRIAVKQVISRKK